MSKNTRRSLHNLKIICGQCKTEIKKDEEDIQCDKCAKTFHALCTKLDKREYDYLMENEREEYKCHFCKESGGGIQNELSLIKTKLDKLDQLDGLVEGMNFLSKQFDEIIKGVADNKKRIDVVQKENKMLKKEIADLKQSVKVLNDNRVKNNCMISGLEQTDVNAADVVKSFMKEAGVEIKEEEIEDAYFLKKKLNTKKQSVVVKFSSYKTKQKIMAVKSKLQEKEETKSIYVNDYLSKETLTLLNHARALKTVGFRRVYAFGGRVYAKMSELSKPKVIYCADDVDNLLLEATTARSRGRRSQNQNEVNAEESGGSTTDLNFLSPNN